MEDICSGLTHVDSHHWFEMQKACADLVDRKVHASFVGTTFVLAATVVFACIQAGTHWAFAAAAYRHK